jgi:hypothetical protein
MPSRGTKRCEVAEPLRTGYSLIIPQTAKRAGHKSSADPRIVDLMWFSSVRPRGLEPLASCSGGKRSIR